MNIQMKYYHHMINVLKIWKLMGSMKLIKIKLGRDLPYPVIKILMPYIGHIYLM
jgi:hypothetical protein